MRVTHEDEDVDLRRKSAWFRCGCVCHSGGAVRVGTGVTRMRAVAMPYEDYLRTIHWKAAKKSALKRVGYRCQVCYAKGRLHVHHRTYERLGCELLSDLTVLCEPCHELFHASSRLTSP